MRKGFWRGEKEEQREVERRKGNMSEKEIRSIGGHSQLRGRSNRLRRTHRNVVSTSA